MKTYTNRQNNIHCVNITINTAAPFIIATADYYGGGRRQYKCCRSLSSLIKTAKQWSGYSYSVFLNDGTQIILDIKNETYHTIQTDKKPNGRDFKNRNMITYMMIIFQDNKKGNLQNDYYLNRKKLLNSKNPKKKLLALLVWA